MYPQIGKVGKRRKMRSNICLRHGISWEKKMTNDHIMQLRADPGSDVYSGFLSFPAQPTQ
eukprot:2850197-Ditylum_brightwellii.AAC.1